MSEVTTIRIGLADIAAHHPDVMLSLDPVQAVGIVSAALKDNSDGVDLPSGWFSRPTANSFTVEVHVETRLLPRAVARLEKASLLW